MEKDSFSFISFITHNRLNRIYLFSTILFTTIGWIAFKYLYPNPNVIFDSYYYLTATVSNASVNAWPIGYSKFVRLAGILSHSANFLLTLQHLILNISLLYFFFTVRYFFQIGYKSSWILLLLLFANPIFPYISNLILSDALFTAFSTLWVIQLLWIIFRPKQYMLLNQALLLLLVFTIRYNALYYPIIATIAFILSRQTIKYKVIGIVLQFLLLGTFITYTTHQMKSRYKVAQFSPFGGWKLANDALYIYEHVYRTNNVPVPAEFQAIDKRVREYFNKEHYRIGLDINDPTWGSFYMYIHPSPLIQQMFSIYGKDAANVNLNFPKFALMGPLYQAYGAYIIKKYPFAFTQHFIIPNIGRYFFPPQEVLVDPYNPFTLRRDYLGTAAIQWFHLTSLQVPAELIQLRSAIFSIYPALVAIIHFLFLFSGLHFLLYRIYRNESRTINFALLSIAALWLVDFSFSVLAAAIVLRYQLFIFIIESAFSLVFAEISFTSKPPQPRHPIHQFNDDIPHKKLPSLP